jgi:hypothetical protein
MKKILVILLLCTAFASCSKQADVCMEKPVDKKVEFHVHAGHNYSDVHFSQVTATVQMEVYKVNTKNGQLQRIWETEIAERTLAQYPHLPQKFLIEKQFPVLESKEKLRAKFSISYKSPQGTTIQSKAQDSGNDGTFLFLDVDV